MRSKRLKASSCRLRAIAASTSASVKHGAPGEDDGQARAGGVEGPGLVLDQLEEGLDAALVDAQAELAQLLLDPSGLLVLEHLEEGALALLADRVLERLLGVEALGDEEEDGVGGGRGEVGREGAEVLLALDELGARGTPRPCARRRGNRCGGGRGPRLSPVSEA